MGQSRRAARLGVLLASLARCTEAMAGRRLGQARLRTWVGRMLVIPSAGGILLTIAAGYQMPVRAPVPFGPAATVTQHAAGLPPASAGGSSRPAASAVAVASLRSAHNHVPAVAPLRRLLPDDLLVVARAGLPSGTVSAVGRLGGVAATEQADAARIGVGGRSTAVLGVDPSSFRAFAAGPTARATALWQGIAAGDIAVSYAMGKLDKLPLGGTVEAAGARTEQLRVGAFGTAGIAGVDAMVSSDVAQSLGFTAGNAMIISAPHTRLAPLIKKIKKLLPPDAAVIALVAQAPARAARPSTPTGVSGAPAVASGGLTPTEVATFLKAALSRVGMPYVWGAAGPGAFDCSGLVQWSLAQAGVIMPRVAADQARTGPRVPISELQPGELLFYHTDPTAPAYISHVAIYLGNGRMLQAPEPGQDVEIVPADLGSGFAGAVEVNPRVAAAVAANPAD